MHTKPRLLFYFWNYTDQKLLMNRSDKSVGANIDSCIATNILDIWLMRCVSSTEFILDSSALTNAEPKLKIFEIHFVVWTSLSPSFGVSLATPLVGSNSHSHSHLFVPHNCGGLNNRRNVHSGFIYILRRAGIVAAGYSSSKIKLGKSRSGYS